MDYCNKRLAVATVASYVTCSLWLSYVEHGQYFEG